MPKTVSLIIAAEIRLLRDGLAEFLNTRDKIEQVRRPECSNWQT
jgi:hypothetical protein